MLKYQNADGGMESGFESDVLCPLSAAIPTAEAIFQAYEYGLDCHSDCFKDILAYFENTVQDIPKYWKAIDSLSSVLWGYTSKDSLDILNKFFPTKND